DFYQDPVTGTQSVYVTGDFWGPANFGGTVISSAGQYDIFVTKMDASDGHPRWVNTMGGPAEDTGYQVAVDGQGNAYVTGIFEGTAQFGPSLTLMTSPGFGAFVAKLDGGDGHVVWAKSGGDGNDDTDAGIAIGQNPTTGAPSVIVTGTVGSD